MPAKYKKIQVFTGTERMVAGLAIVTAIVLALSVQVVQSMTRPSLGLYGHVAPVSAPGVLDARSIG